MAKNFWCVSCDERQSEAQFNLQSLGENIQYLLIYSLFDRYTTTDPVCSLWLESKMLY